MSDLVLDTSAVVAILDGEPEAPALLRALEGFQRRWIGAGTLVELSVVVARRRGEVGLVMLDALLARLRVEVVPVAGPEVTVAREAWLRFGKGRHPAGLNLGDCLSYATARCVGAPLMCKGEDFPRTDLPLVTVAPT